MSRSFRYTPKRRYDGCQSEKQWRKLQHQNWRAKMRQVLGRAPNDEIILPHTMDALNDWDCGKSGRIWFDAAKNPAWMRK